MASYAPIYREERVMQNVLLAAIVPVTIGTCVNMLSAAWLAPLTHHHTTQQNIWKIFKQLSWFSLAAVCIGAADTYFAIHEAMGGGAAIAAYIAVLSASSVTRPVALTAVVISIPAFFIGEVILTGDVALASLLTLGGVVSILVSTAFCVGLSLYSKPLNGADLFEEP